jgi:hypothetical protein
MHNEDVTTELRVTDKRTPATIPTLKTDETPYPPTEIKTTREYQPRRHIFYQSFDLLKKYQSLLNDQRLFSYLQRSVATQTVTIFSVGREVKSLLDSPLEKKLAIGKIHDGQRPACQGGDCFLNLP